MNHILSLIMFVMAVSCDRYDYYDMHKNTRVDKYESNKRFKDFYLSEFKKDMNLANFTGPTINVNLTCQLSENLTTVNGTTTIELIHHSVLYTIVNPNLEVNGTLCPALDAANKIAPPGELCGYTHDLDDADSFNNYEFIRCDEGSDLQVEITDGDKMILNHTVHHEDIYCLDETDYQLFVRDDNGDITECFERDQKFQEMTAPMVLLKECCDEDASCNQHGHKFSIHVFEPPREYYDWDNNKQVANYNKLYRFYNVLRVGIKQLPWFTRPYEQIQLYLYSENDRDQQIVSLQALGEGVHRHHEFNLTEDYFSNQIKCQNYYLYQYDEPKFVLGIVNEKNGLEILRFESISIEEHFGDVYAMLAAKNYSVYLNDTAKEVNVTATSLSGEEFNVTLDLKLTYYAQSSELQCHLGSSYPIDFPQCQLYNDEKLADQLFEEKDIRIDSEVIDEILNQGQLLEDVPIISVGLESENEETFDLQKAVEKSGSKIFYEFNKKAESKVKKIKIVEVPDNGILLYNKPMVKVNSYDGWSHLLFYLTGIPYFQVVEKMDTVKQIAHEDDIIDLEQIYNLTMQPMRTDRKVEGTLKFMPVGVWEGSGQEVELQFAKKEEETEMAQKLIIGVSLILSILAMA